MRTLLLFLIALSSGNALEAPFESTPLPETGEEWISLSADAEFLPAPSGSSQALRQAQRRFLGYADSFVDGNTYYDEYSQAWRVLGWYIDCSYYSSQRKRRSLENANQDDTSNGEAEDTLTCERYLLWAAYVDLDYQGGGIGEYQFFNDESRTWDRSACDASGGKRCALMDCHLQTTHFKLLGYFKQYDYGDFFEQLFKHEAYCIWSDSEYEFMQAYRDWWPEGCQNTGQTVGNSNIYMDIKPLRSGDMGLGLYVDAACSRPYVGRSVKIESLVESYEGGSIDDHINSWNSALGIFKKCQPCKAFDLLSATAADGGDDSSLFQCDDAAGYTNVNQCMKFHTHTAMMKATYRDVELASRQGTINPTYLNDVSLGFMSSWGFFAFSAVLFLVGLAACILSAKPKRKRRGLAKLSARSNVTSESLLTAGSS